MNKKTILLGMPFDNEIFRLIEKNLKYHGFDVVSIVDDISQFRYPSLSARLKTKFQQLILKDKQAKSRLKTKLAKQKIVDLLNHIGEVDYALFIRADIYSYDLLEYIREHVKFDMVNYQWDGMHRYPDIQSRISLFDRFYVFDPSDISSNTLPNTNFYFDYDLDDLPNPINDFYFVGSHLPGRDISIANFSKFAQEKGWKLDFHIFCGSNPGSYRNFYPNNNINLFNKYRNFQENLERAKLAKVLVDFKTPIHNGLSFRVFEALGYQRKLITTNTNIIKYDFYHPNNIFVWNGIQMDDIDNFLETPYYEIDPSISEKYSFRNWIHYILNIKPYQSIDLPNHIN